MWGVRSADEVLGAGRYHGRRSQRRSNDDERHRYPLPLLGRVPKGVGNQGKADTRCSKDVTRKTTRTRYGRRMAFAIVFGPATLLALFAIVFESRHEIK